MKALTICQPYAHLIVRGEKMVENREWSTPYRGLLAIHAGKNRAWLDDDDEQEYQNCGDPLVFGAVVGHARLVDVLHIKLIERKRYDKEYPWLREHAHTNGTWCWVSLDVQRYAKPMPWRGAQGLFEIPDASLTPNVQIEGRAAFGASRSNAMLGPKCVRARIYCP